MWAYIDDMIRRRAEISRSIDAMTVSQFVGVLQSNVINVYPNIVQDYGRDCLTGRKLTVTTTINMVLQEEERLVYITYACGDNSGCGVSPLVMGILRLISATGATRVTTKTRTVATALTARTPTAPLST